MAALCILLTAVCVYDYRGNRIPNRLVAVMAVWGGVWRLLDGGPPDMLFYLGEAILVMALVYPFFRIGTIGAGDVKLLGVTAGYLPFGKILMFLFVSLLVAAIFSLIKMWKEKSFSRRLRCLSRYLAKVAGSGRWQLYPGYGAGGGAAGIHLAGPVLLGMLLYLGGVY